MLDELMAKSCSVREERLRFYGRVCELEEERCRCVIEETLSEFRKANMEAEFEGSV